MDKQKTLGQVYTPTWVVETILDKVGYTADNSDILSQRIMEPSFGEGAFLYPIIERLIAQAETQNKTPQEISRIISENIHGIEYDEEAYSKTIQNLNGFIASQSLPPVTWRLDNADALLHKPETEYDYVVGNPPYIRIHNMTPDMREAVKQYTHSHGTTDLYIIFYEIGLEWLSDAGKLGYITPNSYMKNTSQLKFRDYLLEHKHLTEIVDFGSRPIFGTAATYTAITVLDKANVAETVTYSYDDGSTNYISLVSYNSLLNQAWVFPNEDDFIFLQENSQKEPFSAVASIQYGVATLRDKIFLNHPTEIESGLLKQVYKASTYSGGETGTIIFPYVLENGKQVLIPEHVLASEYPVGYAYLLSHKEELLARDIDKNGEWYQYGRSQGLNGVQQSKLIITSVVSSKQRTLKAHVLPPESVVYSGFYITEKPGGLTLEELKDVVESESFCRYVKLLGKDMSGGFKSVTPKMVKTYGI